MKRRNLLRQTTQFSLRRYSWVLLIILILGAALRIYDIAARPLHSDEGVNYHFVEEVLRRGFYPYSHENYHGPAFFYSLTAFAAALPMNELTLRGTSILFGVLLIALPFLYFELFTLPGAIIASLLLAISPSMVFHSRYAIHEMMYLFFQALFALELLWAIRHKRISLRSMLVLSGTLAVLIALKETFVIPIFWVAVSAFIANDRKVTRTIREAWRNRSFWWPMLLKGAVVCATVTMAIFSAFFYWSKGVREMFLALPQWFGRGTSSDVGHFKPFVYYTNTILVHSEPWLLLIGLSLCISLWTFYHTPNNFRPASHSTLFFSIWAFGSWLTYSLIPYKTPWLIINITVPAVLAYGAFLGELLTAGSRYPSFVARLFTILAVFGSVYWGAKLNYSRDVVGPGAAPYGERNPYSYVHTSPGFLDVVAHVEKYRSKHPDARILVAVPSYWPLPFYFRRYSEHVGYIMTDDFGPHKDEYSIIIAENNCPWRDPEYAHEYRRLSDVQESFIYFKGGVP